MRLTPDGSVHLTYCTNIHPADGWAAVFENLQRFAPALKQRVSPDAPFGLGLRLSARDSEELLEGDHLDRFADFLAGEGLYVALVNGFPYGGFHRREVKSLVFAPDWTQPARVEYTLRLVRILARLLPEGVDGGISTCPLSYKRWIKPGDRTARRTMARNCVAVAAAMDEAGRGSGRRMHLDLEPEPDGLVETAGELADFHREWLVPEGGRLAAERLQACVDACHSAVEFEDPSAALDRLANAGVRVGRLQLSAALDVALPGGEEERRRRGGALEPFAESVYLHQVVEQGDDGLRRYADLPEAMGALNRPGARRWRVHFHVPLFLDRYGELGSTRPQLLAWLALARRRGFTRHLEIETYTWDVLPPAYRLDLAESIQREFEWVRAAWEEA